VEIIRFVFQAVDFGAGLDIIEHVVEARNEIVDVFAIERRDERAVQALDGVMGDNIPLRAQCL
jgi:hypothetical protein